MRMPSTSPQFSITEESRICNSPDFSNPVIRTSLVFVDAIIPVEIDRLRLDHVDAINSEVER